jgi:hypothetical protein
MATAYTTCGSGMRITGNIRRPCGARFALGSRGKSSPPVTCGNFDRSTRNHRMKVQCNQASIASAPGSLSRRRGRHDCAAGIPHRCQARRRPLVSHRQLRSGRYRLRMSYIDIG